MLKTFVPLLALGLGGLVARSSSASIDFLLSPPAQTARRCDVIEVQLRLQSNAGANTFDSLDAALSWDPSLLTLLDHDEAGAGAPFFLTGFFPDPDGVNANTADGSAIFTALVPPGLTGTATAAPGSLLVTTFTFEVISTANTTTPIALLSTIGTFGSTRALLAGADLTGIDDPSADVELDNTCPWDIDANTGVGFNDLTAVLIAWGPCVDTCCIEDIDANGDVGFGDLSQLLINWGPCP